MMREFRVPIPANAGIVTVDDVEISLTSEDARDLTEGRSITTLTPSGEEVAVFPGADARPHELPEAHYNLIRDSIRAAGQWMLDHGFSERETRDWLYDTVGDARSEGSP